MTASILGHDPEKIEVRTVDKVRKDAIKVVKKIKKKYAKSKLYYVDDEIADKVVKFVTILKHTGGALAGVNFQLLPFQVEFIIEMLAVLQKKNGFRKHKLCILHVPRKQGKTEIMSAIALFMFFLDKEKQKEIYVLASETKQATILYEASISMLKQTPALVKRVNIWRSTKTVENKEGHFKDIFNVLTANAKTKDGLKGSTIIADEAHAYPDSSLFDVMTESMAHRDQPLSIIISTSGYNKNGFFHRLLGYASDAQSGKINDDSIFLMSFAVGDDEDWTLEENWIKANPALGYGVKLDYLRDKFKKAQHSAVEEVGFRTKHLNQWVDSAVTWIRDRDWKASDANIANEEDFIGRECYGGLDLSSVSDLTALVYVFPDRVKKTYDVLCRFFVPEDNARERSRTDRVPYLEWIKEGHITATAGNVVDYDYIEEQIRRDSKMFDIKEIAFDRWNSHALVNNLMQDEEVTAQMVAFGQGYKSMSSPVKHIETLVLEEKLKHGNNPVLGWCVGNVLIISDPADNVKIDKSKAREKVDGAVALAMAVGRADVYINNEPDFDSLIG